MTAIEGIVPQPANGAWIVRREVDERIVARGFESYEEADEFCGDFDDVYACQYRSAAWEQAFDVLCRRADNAERDADSLDDSFAWMNLSLANDAISAVGDAYPAVCEDDPITRFACYVVALEAAVAQAAEDYAEVRPHQRSGWESEAFPKAALGL